MSPRTPRPRHRLAATVAAGLTVVLASTTGCGPELQDVPVPSQVSGPTYPVELVFESALNLPQDAPVKLDGATVGVVESITAQDYTARVQVQVSEEVQLHRGLAAELRLTSPMGTAFVDLRDGRGPTLAAGARVALDSTRRAPDVSDLLSSLSVLVTGGSYEDIGVIVDELNTALDGNEGGVRSLIGRLDTALGSFNARTAEFDRMLAGLDRFSTQLAADGPRLLRAVQRFRPAIRTLSAQQGQLVALLAEVRRFGRSGGEVLRASRDDLVSVLDDLGPVLRTVIRTREHLRPLMEGLSAFARNTDRSAPGDFNNFDLFLRVDPAPLLDPSDEERPGAENDGGLPLEELELPHLPGLPELPALPLQRRGDR